MDQRVKDAVASAFDFADFDDETLDRLAASCSVHRVARGEVVFEKGAPADGLYVVTSGSVGIEDSIHGRDMQIAAIEPGDFFGEVGLALHTARTRTARARADAEVVFVPAEAVQRLTAIRPHLEQELMGAYEDRMARRESQAEE